MTNTPSDKQTDNQPALQPPELLPCPFCGGVARSSPTGTEDGGIYVDRWAINCGACNFEMIEMATEGDKPWYATALQKLSRKWNTRARVGVATVDAIREAAEEISEFYARRYNENAWEKDVKRVAAIIEHHYAATAPIAAPVGESGDDERDDDNV